MNTPRTNHLTRWAGLGLALALLAGSATLVGAQPTGKGGATQLMKASAPATVSAPQTMVCPMCKDEYVPRTDASARGANKPVVKVARHLCADCQTVLATRGEGKAKHQVAVHSCGSNQAAICCAR